MRNFAFLGLLAVPFFAVACASPAASDGADNAAADSTGSVPAPFTAADHLDSFMGRVRVSVDGATPVETDGMCAVDSWTKDAQRFECSANNVFGSLQQLMIKFGHAEATAVTAGDVYTTATGDGAVDNIAWQMDGTTETAGAVTRATTASVTIDSVGAAPSPSTEMRVIGHFSATAGGTDGLAHSVEGTFLMDVPHPVAVTSDGQ